MEKNDYLNVLRNNIATIEFTKTNGDLRVMRATLLPKYLPEAVESQSETPRHLNDNVVACWDLEADGWRSFRINTVTKFEVETNNV